ncbi:MAG: hypothetical protein KDH98_23020, partial [Calditrichaeota bacterium]|nr:hypothetical protein [Calditrichota bacterium]
FNWALPKLAHSWRHPDSPSAWELKDFIHDAKHLGTGVLQLFTTIGSSGLPRMLGIDYHHTEYKDQQAGLIPLIIATLKKKPPIQIAIIALMIPVLLMIYISTITGIVHAWRKWGFRHIALLLFIIGYIIMTAAGFANTERFRLPLMPFLYIFAAHGMAVIHNKWQHRKKDHNAVIITRQPTQHTKPQQTTKPSPSPIGN